MIQTKKDRLLICSTCESRGIRSVLGELGTAGDFRVLRFGQSETIINSPAYQVFCGICGNMVYFKNPTNLGTTGSIISTFFFQGTFVV